jgi:hypothetical protein
MGCGDKPIPVAPAIHKEDVRKNVEALYRALGRANELPPEYRPSASKPALIDDSANIDPNIPF